MEGRMKRSSSVALATLFAGLVVTTQAAAQTQAPSLPEDLAGLWCGGVESPSHGTQGVLILEFTKEKIGTWRYYPAGKAGEAAMKNPPSCKPGAAGYTASPAKMETVKYQKGPSGATFVNRVFNFDFDVDVHMNPDGTLHVRTIGDGGKRQISGNLKRF
jgi:hypothetical protein